MFPHHPTKFTRHTTPIPPTNKHAPNRKLSTVSFLMCTTYWKLPLHSASWIISQIWGSRHVTPVPPTDSANRSPEQVHNSEKTPGVNTTYTPPRSNASNGSSPHPSADPVRFSLVSALSANLDQREVSVVPQWDPPTMGFAKTVCGAGKRVCDR